MKIGAYYYPEQWPQEQWERDFDRMAAMGLQIVHMGEFAWFSLEPHAGEFRFEWLDRCIDMARKRHIEVILCTPTAAPPIWLVQEHPDILPIDEHGTPFRFGGRRHYSPTAPAMLQATIRIVTAMAQHFGDRDGVIGWQIDNELSSPIGFDKFDQNEHVHIAFRRWLQQKYGTIENLNRAWGNQFWNTYYTSFAQVLLMPSRDPVYGNPHHALDSSRFWSNAFADFTRLQANILKQHVGSRWITTNFMPFHLDVDPGALAEDLTMMTWDSYPVSGREFAPQDDHFRIADPAAIGIMHDQMRSYGRPWALMELQPGHINWSGYPVLPYPGAIRLWIWTALAHGADFVTTYRFRQPRFGIEMFHDGLVETDGVTMSSPGGRQFTQVIDELKRIDHAKWRSDAGKIDPKRTIGLLFDFEQLWWFATLPQAKRWNQPRFLQLWYSAMAPLGLDVRILHPKHDWPEEIKFIVAPAFQMVDDADVQRLHEFAERGGHLVLTCRSAMMDRTGQMFEGKTAEPILDLIGGEIEAYDSLPLEKWGQVELDGKNHPWGVWGDLMYAAEDTKVLAKYADQFYAGAAAVIQCRRSNGGAVTYCGVHGEQSFTEALMEKLTGQAGLTTTPLPTRVQLIRKGPYRVLLNYQDTVFNAPAPRGARFVVGSRRVDPAGVAIWEE
jgi:beta-galactosidase